MVSCIPLCIFSTLGLEEHQLKSSQSTLRGVSGINLENLGYIDVMVACNKIKEQARLYVSRSGCELILGIKFCKKFKLATSCIL